ncbi:hypothetical protein OHA53_00235 [Streptomyces althioticus]|jgi:hypothetical protein|uniref:hypothetical protein n=1 Tax=Streptomyces althioticus TaxID=83380 RepID=UPI003873AA99|nr:hypothetical protein OHA53_00235 [Streptomyces althioticus]
MQVVSLGNGGTADDRVGPTLRRCKARKVARWPLVDAGYVDVVSLKEIEAAAVAVGRIGDIRRGAGLLASGYDPATAYTPQTGR